MANSLDRPAWDTEFLTRPRRQLVEVESAKPLPSESKTRALALVAEVPDEVDGACLASELALKVLDAVAVCQDHKKDPLSWSPRRPLRGQDGFCTSVLSLEVAGSMASMILQCPVVVKLPRSPSWKSFWPLESGDRCSPSIAARAESIAPEVVASRAHWVREWLPGLALVPALLRVAQDRDKLPLALRWASSH